MLAVSLHTAINMLKKMLNVLPKDNSKHTEDISCPCKPTIHYRGLLPVLIHNDLDSELTDEIIIERHGST